MVTFKSFNRVIKILDDGYAQFLKAIHGEKYKMSAVDVIYKTTAVDAFKNEFKEIVYNNSGDIAKVKAYIQEVYYNGIVRYKYLLRELLITYAKKHNNDYIMLANDDIFTKLSNGYISTLSLLADYIVNETKKTVDLELANHYAITREDYNIQGEYIALLEDSKPKPNKAVKSKKQRETPDKGKVEDAQQTSHPTAKSKDVKKISEKLSYKEVAYIIYYNHLAKVEEGVTNQNKNSIAKKYKLASGHKLYIVFNSLNDYDIRAGIKSSRSDKYLKKLFEKVLPHLNYKALQRAKDEYKKFTKEFEKHR